MSNYLVISLLILFWPLIILKLWPICRKSRAKKTIQLTYCKRFDNSCYHHQCIANRTAVILLQVLIGHSGEKRCKKYQLVHTEFMNIKRMLSRNGYPNNFLDRCIQQFLNRKYVVTQQRDAPAEPSPSPKYISLQLPYLGSISNNIRQELSSFIRHKAVVNVKLRCFSSTRKLQSWFSIKTGKLY